MRFLFALVVDLVKVVFWPLLAFRRLRAAPKGAWLRLDIDGAVVEVAERLPFWDRRPRPVSLMAVRRVVELAADDPRVAGLLVVIKHLAAGSATATSLRSLLLEARAKNKRVVAYLPTGGGTRETYVASAAERVLIGPDTHLAPMGFAVEVQYFKRALDKLGVVPEVFAKGRFKTAAEPLVAEGMSDAQKEQLDAVLDVAWETLVEALASGRSVKRELAESWVHQGPWFAKAAVDQGLVDAMAYEDELDEKLEPRVDRPAPIMGVGTYRRRRSIAFRPLFRKPKIGVVQVHGPIVSKHVGLLPMAVEDDVIKALTMAREDRKVRGVVLHVDSRGGSALASDRMLHEVQKLARQKPVVACMGDAAASGGYMVAVGAHAIVAQPTTLTGSIGVVSARMVIKPLLERLGIGVDVLKRGDRADMLSAARALAPDERQVLERQVDEIYESFVLAVASGRGKSVEEIEPLAQGRVWSGHDAHRVGLVDELGGFDVALAELKRRVGPAAEGLEPAVLSPRRVSSPSGMLPRLLFELADGAGLGALADDAKLALAAPRERIWSWCGVTESDLAAR